MRFYIVKFNPVGINTLVGTGAGSFKSNGEPCVPQNRDNLTVHFYKATFQPAPSIRVYSEIHRYRSKAPVMTCAKYTQFSISI